MYVLIIARGYPTKRYKMNGIFEFDQAKALAQAGHKVIYAAVDVRSIRRWRKWGFESFKQDGVQVEAINIPGGRIPKTILRKMQMSGLKNLYKRIETKYGKPDIMHAHFAGMGYVAAQLKKQIGVYLVVSEHYSGINKNKIERNLYKVAGIVYNHADALIAVSETLAKSIKMHFNKDSTVIPNMVDTGIFSSTLKNKNKQYSFISVGNLTYNKRMDLVIEVFHEAFKFNSDVRLIIFGEGTERPRLEKLIKDNQLKNRVALLGMQSREIIAEYLKQSDCFVLASQSETFGVAYIEALAMGVPIIATNCGGPEGFVHKDNGILIDADDAKGLTEAMLKMYNESTKFDREKIAQEIIDKFSPQTIARQLTDVYKSLLNQNCNKKTFNKDGKARR